MGVYYGHYIGPYILAKKETIKIPVGIKLNSKGSEFDSHINYDPDSGEKLTTSTKLVPKKIIPDPYIEEEGFEKDMFWSPGYGCGEKEGEVVFMLNHSDEEVGVINLDNEKGVGITELGNIIPKDYIEKFEKSIKNIWIITDPKITLSILNTE